VPGIPAVETLDGADHLMTIHQEMSWVIGVYNRGIVVLATRRRRDRYLSPMHTRVERFPEALSSAAANT
jgi:hypothetical protein